MANDSVKILFLTQNDKLLNSIRSFWGGIVEIVKIGNFDDIRNNREGARCTIIDFLAKDQNYWNEIDIIRTVSRMPLIAIIHGKDFDVKTKLGEMRIEGVIEFPFKLDDAAKVILRVIFEAR